MERFQLFLFRQVLETVTLAYTKKEIEERFGIKSKRFNAIVNGGEPTITEFERLCTILGISPTLFFGSIDKSALFIYKEMSQIFTAKYGQEHHRNIQAYRLIKELEPLINERKYDDAIPVLVKLLTLFETKTADPNETPTPPAGV